MSLPAAEFRSPEARLERLNSDPFAPPNSKSIGSRSHSKVSPAQNSAPTTEGIKQMQVSDFEQCLDLNKLFAAAEGAPKARIAVSDIRIADDGTPISGAFVSNVFKTTPLVRSPIGKQLSSHWTQRGCQVLVMLNEDGEEVKSVRLATANPTHLVSDKMKLDDLPESLGGVVQLEVQLVTDQSFRFKTVTPGIVEHDPNNCRGRESHSIQTEGIVEFGDPTGSSPKVSSDLARLKAQADLNSPADAARKGEADYCWLINHPEARAGSPESASRNP
jgi:hypothetical protein